MAWQTISERLAAAGWTRTDRYVLGSVTGRGAELNVTPSKKDIGAPLPLKSLLPPGAKVQIPEEGEGAVEYSSRSHYVRLAPGVDHEDPISVLRDMIDAGVTIEVLS